MDGRVASRRAPRAHAAVASSIVLVLLLTAMAVFTTARPAAACSCARTTDAQAFAVADAVFVGELVEIRTPAGANFSSADPEQFVFDVARVHKGTVLSRQSVITAREGASCGLELTPRTGQVLVFARRDDQGTARRIDGALTADLCGGTRAVVASEPVPASFGPGSAPPPGASPVDADSTTSTWLIPTLATAVVLVGGAWYANRRRTRPRPTG